MKELLQELQGIKTFADQSESALNDTDLKNDNELQNMIVKIQDLADTCIEYVNESN